MSRKTLTATIVAALVWLITAVPGSCREIKIYTIEQFMKTISLRAGAFSFDEKRLLFSSDETGTYNAYSMPVAGGPAVQLTRSRDDSIFALAFLPHDDRILYHSDRGGDERGHIYLRDEAGKVEDLTPYEGAKATFHGFSHDQTRFYFGCNKRDLKFMDIYEMDMETFTPRMVFQSEGPYSLGSVSRDRRYLAFKKTITRENSDMYLYDTRTGDFKLLTEHQGDANFFPMAFSPDSRSVLCLTDEGDEFIHLKRYDLQSGDSATVLKTDGDLRFAYYSHTGKYLVVGINRDARNEVRLYDAETTRPIDLPDPPHGRVSSVIISRSEKLMCCSVTDSRSPENLFVYDFATRRYAQLTKTLNPEIDPDDLVEARQVRYTSFDGLEIPAVLYKPHLAESSNKVPAMIWVHGGPGGQTGVGYNPLFQYIVNHGYAVLAVNHRGSSGYGKTFYRLDNHKHGKVDLDDCVEAKKFLAATGYVDEDRVGIIGGSYGGFMVLAALAFRPNEFALGVDMFGVSNWLRTLTSLPVWWDPFKNSLYAEIGDPRTEETYLRSISPLFHANNIVKPLMVLQGKNDPRVLKTESDEIVDAVRKRGVPVEYLVFDDEGHGFLKKENRIKGYGAILTFLETYSRPSKNAPHDVERNGR